MSIYFNEMPNLLANVMNVITRLENSYNVLNGRGEIMRKIRHETSCIKPSWQLVALANCEIK